MYLIEKMVLGSVWVITFLSLWFTPRKNAAPASFIYLLTQVFTWILGLFAVEYHWIEYPVRELSKANSTSFSYEFFIFPVITVYFILHYPKDKPLLTRILYFVAFCSVFTFIEVMLEKYTFVVEYHAWRWYWTWMSMAVVFYIVMIIYRWFYRMRGVFSI